MRIMMRIMIRNMDIMDIMDIIDIMDIMATRDPRSVVSQKLKVQSYSKYYDPYKSIDQNVFDWKLYQLGVGRGDKGQWQN